MRYFYILVLSLLTTTLIAQPSFEELIDAAQKQLREKNYNEAASLFEEALAITPTDTVALSGIIRTFTSMKEYRSAHKYIDQALNFYPDMPEYNFRRGIVFKLTENYEKAISEFDLALQLKPRPKLKIQILLNRAAALYRLQRYNDALNDCNTVSEIDPRNPKVYNLRGLVNYKLGYYIDAITDYNNSLDLEPNIPIIHYNRGMTYLKINETEKACHDFHMACKGKFINACKMIITRCGSK